MRAHFAMTTAWAALAAAVVALSGCVVEARRDPPPDTMDRDAAQAAAVLGQRYEQSQPAGGTDLKGLPEITEESDLSDYLTYAAMNSHEMEAAYDAWTEALDKADRAGWPPDRYCNYHYFIEDVESRKGDKWTMYGLAQPVRWPGEKSGRVSAATEGVYAARERYEGARLHLFYRVKNAYYEYNYLGQAIALVTQARDRMKPLAEAGGPASPEKDSASPGQSPAAAAAADEQRKLQERLKTLWGLQKTLAANLNDTLDRPADARVSWPKNVTARPIAASDDQVFAWMKEANPELGALEHEATEAERAIHVAQKDYYPDFNLGVHIINSLNHYSPGVPGYCQDEYVAMVWVQSPVWFESYAAEVREARTRHWEALRKKAERENALGSEVQTALYQLRDAQRRLALYRNTLVPKGRQSLAAAEDAQARGPGKPSDVVDARRVLLEFELAYDRAVADHEIRVAQVEMLVGRNIPRQGEPSAP